MILPFYHILLKHKTYNSLNTVLHSKMHFIFWVKSSKTGIHVLEVVHNDASYNNAHQYTIASANTWQNVVITFDGYTATAINDDNGKGLELNWWLIAGSTYSGGTYSENTWDNTNANRAVGQKWVIAHQMIFISQASS